MITYTQFKKMNIDLGPLGFQQNGDFVLYYCTPKNANIQVGGQAVLGRQVKVTTPWHTERHGYDPTYSIQKNEH